jgi:hypothetical protein
MASSWMPPFPCIFWLQSCPTQNNMYWLEQIT